MTVYKRGAIFLNCLICGHGDFEIVRRIRTREKVLKCKRCGFMMKDSGYFDQMPGGTPVPEDGSSMYAVRKKGLADVKKK